MRICLKFYWNSFSLSLTVMALACSLIFLLSFLHLMPTLHLTSMWSLDVSLFSIVTSLTISRYTFGLLHLHFQPFLLKMWYDSLDVSANWTNRSLQFPVSTSDLLTSVSPTYFIPTFALFPITLKYRQWLEMCLPGGHINHFADNACTV